MKGRNGAHLIASVQPFQTLGPGYEMHCVFIRDVIDSRQIDKSTFSLCQLNQIEWLGIESK